MNEIQKVKSWKIVLPVIIGLLVILYMFLKEFKISAFDGITVTWLSVFWFAMAFLCIFMRDFGYVVRIKVLSENRLSWKQAFRIIMLWEFTSTVTPGALGGTSVALMYVHKEGISLGKSSSIVMLTSLFDELYFVIVFPLLLLVLGRSTLFFSVEDASFDIETLSGWSYGLFWFAIIAYSIKLVWVLMLVYGLFINPKNFSRFIYSIFKLPFLKRWKRNAV
ncbi:MAG: flippase-like domain-containing protein, partial [Prevotellaceae bacterium]|nr:flippase-like domain-containing protein [Prevotellaceae bacterium]